MDIQADNNRDENNQDTPQPTESMHPRALRMRVGLGAGVVLVLLAAGVAVLISAVSTSGGSTSSAASTDSAGSARSAASSTSRYTSTTSSAQSSSTSEDDGPAPTDSSTAFVQVVGDVQRPGLYELPTGDRIVDAVAAAGGFTPTADQASLNLAQVISDGQQIVVAAQGAAPVAAGASDGSSPTGVVDINTADATGLETLDGIGPALAQRILAYRTAHGGFRSINDLQNVTGIGPKKFAAVKSSVSV